jgi:glucose-6-phosphate isomerase
MDKTCFQQDLHTNLPLLAALIEVWNHNFLHYPTTAIIPYSQPLHRFPAHLQQVGMESNGKMIDKKGDLTDFETGAIWWGEPGTNGQHSFFQLLHQGTGVIPVCFIGYKESQLGEDLLVQGTFSQEKLLANMFAQSLGLALGNQTDNLNKFTPGNRPSHILLANRLTPYSLGALLSFWENKVDFIGFIWDINSFDQEGVQLGKVLANKIINQLACKHQRTQDKPSYPLGEAYLKHLDRL